MIAPNSALSLLEAAIGAQLAMRRARPSLPALRLEDRFEVRTIAGTGAFGTVIHAWDQRLQRDVALKCIPVDDPERMSEALAVEARALAKVSAPEVVDVYDWLPICVDSSRVRLPCLAIVMEYVSGRSLRHWIKSRRGLDERLAVLISAAKGLEAAHAVGLVHRDFKPENVMVTEEGQAKLVDFGLTYRVAQVTSCTSLARRGDFGLGTPEYMAPELLSGPARPASDQFSFAVTAWEVLTGKRPFDPGTGTSKTPREFAGAKELSRYLTQTLGRALQGSCDERFATIAELRGALERSGDTFNRVAAIVAGAAAVGAVATAAYLAGKDSREPNE